MLVGFLTKLVPDCCLSWQGRSLVSPQVSAMLATLAQLRMLFAECVGSPQFLCTFPQGLTCTLVHMNTLQRAWIFHGWCKNAFSGRFLMWLLERAPLTLQRYLLWALPSPSLLKRVMAVATPSVGIVPCFLIEFQILGGNFISFFCTRQWVGLQLGNKRQTHTPTFLPTEPC